MKINILSSIFSFTLLLLISSCGKDNYDEPEYVLSGKVVYQGEALNLRGTGERIRIQLYQDGYEKHDPIEVFVGQEGTFSAKLFGGNYKLVTRNGNGPWENNRDTINVEVKGSTQIEVAVTPFFTVSNASIALANNMMTTSFTINKIVPTAEIDRIILLLNTTSFVDDEINIMHQNFTSNTTGAVNFTADLTGNNAVSAAKALYGRVCVWSKGADQGIYSPVVRLK